MQVRYLPEAEIELGEQAEYLLAHAGPEVVQSFLALVDTHADLLLRFPRLGTIVPAIDDLRRLRLGNFQMSLARPDRQALAGSRFAVGARQGCGLRNG
jgi:plasmid stabilization system protein ParE